MKGNFFIKLFYIILIGVVLYYFYGWLWADLRATPVSQFNLADVGKIILGLVLISFFTNMITGASKGMFD